ncbi:MAG TPA: flagellar hook-associated protein FlgL [Nocardioidaceae bacterium]|nr:flagellar hook-associated protein FlgL [Nocardioidaceae bacterium]
MSDYRVTQRMMVQRSLEAMNAGASRLARTQEQLSTGRVINRPSDSPTGTNTAMMLRARTADQSQYARNAEDGLGWLGRIDSTLMSASASVRKVRDLALQGASTGSSSPQSREALAIEVTQIREALLGLANTTHLGRPLFGGTTAGPAAYDENGGYVGDTGTVRRTVADGVRVRVDVTGPEVFGSGDDALFTVLDDVAAHLRSDPTALAGDLDQLDGALSRLRSELADIGTRYGRVEAAAQTAKDTKLELQTSLSGVENVDLAQAIVDLQMQEIAYQGALAATARVLQPSLIDFLR